MLSIIKSYVYLLLSKYHLRKSIKISKEFKDAQMIADRFLVNAKSENDKAMYYVEKANTVIKRKESLA